MQCYNRFCYVIACNNTISNDASDTISKATQFNVTVCIVTVCNVIIRTEVISKDTKYNINIRECNIPVVSIVSTSSKFLLISTKRTNLGNEIVPFLFGSADLTKFA